MEKSVALPTPSTAALRVLSSLSLQQHQKLSISFIFLVPVWFHYSFNFHFPDSQQILTPFYVFIGPYELPFHINNFLRLFVMFKSILGDFHIWEWQPFVKCVINIASLLILLISVYHSSLLKNGLSLCSWKCLFFSFTHIKYLIYMPFLAKLVCQRLTGILKAIKLSLSSKASGRFRLLRNGLIYFRWVCISFLI